MNREFHYYLTYLIAARANFSPRQAYIIAYASQLVDDNDKVFTISQGSSAEYRNYLSQTLDITKPQSKLSRIYPCFHFVPGDYQVYSQKLIDDSCPPLTTTPDSKYANEMMTQALATDNLYRIGIACHAYADTWAHQNFIGCWDQHNSLGEVFEPLIPDIGHANAGHAPDIINCTWQDSRLVNATVDNQDRFLTAAGRIFTKLVTYHSSSHQVETARQSLLADLRGIIKDNQTARSRLLGYQALARQEEYGEQEIPPYDQYDWFAAAVKGLPPVEIDFLIKEIHPLEPVAGYQWQNNYQQTHWYKFQEAVKEHQWLMLDILQAVVTTKRLANY